MMSNGSPRSQQSPSGGRDEATVDPRRYMRAVSRSRTLMVVIVIVLTGVVVGISLVVPKSYEARATIVVDFAGGILGPVDATTAERTLATYDELIVSSDVRTRAARRVGDVTAAGLEPKVKSSVDPEANLIDVVASDSDPDRAAAIANAVTNTFLDQQREQEQTQIEREIEALRAQQRQVEDERGGGSEVAAIQARIDELAARLAGEGEELRIAERAEPSTTPASPRPLRNGVVALFAALFLGVLVALGRDQLRPTITDPRELSRLSGYPVLVGVPLVRKRFARNRAIVAAMEHEAYQSLAATVTLALPPGSTQVILVTSGLHAEGKTTVSARLGRVLAQAGHRTLLVSGDVRWPRLHERFDLPRDPGLTDVLELAQRAGVTSHLLPATVHSVGVGADASGKPESLDILTAGSKVAKPAQLLSGKPLRDFVGYVRSFGYQYVLIDGPPMLGIADVQNLATESDWLLLVSWLDRVTVDNVADINELIGRLQAKVLGQVAIGAQIDVSPYYLPERSLAIRNPQGSGAPGTAGERR